MIYGCKSLIKMCWSCHQGLSDETIAQQLTSALEDPKFDQWNECSLSHLLIIGAGYNGDDNKGKAIDLLDMYKRYLLTRGRVFKWAQVKMRQSTFKLPTDLPSPV